MNKKTYITNSREETVSLGKRFAEELKKGDFLAFYGNLGSGKTTFIQGLAQGLGVKRRVISPTFIIQRRYSLKNGNFYHMDLYRTGSINDLLGIGIDEILGLEDNIIALEWAEKMEGLLPKKRIEFHFKYLDEDKRRIVITEYE